jgi:exonuclease SbcC
MNTADLIPTLRQSFATCTLVSKDLDMVRCERLYENRPRSVYFFQSVPALPNNEELAKINQEVVSPSYFGAQDASRWNHYVVFVAQDAKKASATFLGRQRELEDDKSYARKIVIFRSELEAFVDHSLGRTIPEAPGDSILTTWSRRLRAAGLGQIEEDTARAPLIRDIRAGRLTPELDGTGAQETEAEAPASPARGFINEFRLNRFGTRKISGVYGFGRVNLLRGPNGSGKTSLLEAIEHFICGATYRARGGSEEFEATAIFGNRAVARYQELSNPDAQAKDLRWYGRTINRGNRLFEGFARFNFFNTDAAAHFAGEKSLPDLKAALSLVALGPDAAHTWNRMGEFDEDIVRELGPLSDKLSDLATRVMNASGRLAALQTDSPQVESQRALLNDALRDIGWPPRQTPDKQADSDWFQELAVLREFLEASIADESLRSEASVSKAAREVARDLKTWADLDALARAQAIERETLRRRRVAHEQRGVDLRRLQNYIGSSFRELCAREESCVQQVTTLSSRLIPAANLESLRRFLAQSGELDVNFAIFHGSLAERLKAKRQQLEVSSRQRLEIQQRMRSTEALLAEIRRLGREFASAEPHGAGCPLCHTAMDMATLVERIGEATDQSAQSSDLTALSRAIGDISATVEGLVAAQLTCASLSKSAPVGTDIAMLPLIDSSLREHQTFEETQVQLRQLRAELGLLQKNGFSAREYAELIGRLRRELESSPEQWGLPELDLAIKDNTAALVVLNEEEIALRRAIEEGAVGRAQLSQKYGGAEVEAADARKRMQVRLSTLARLANSFKALPSDVRRAHSEDLLSLASHAAQVMNIVDELNTQIQKERARSSEVQVLRAQLARGQTQQANLNAESERLARAQRLLQDLRTNHSLDVGLSNFLTANLDAIQSIFSKIHVPHELRLSDLAECRLERIDSEQPADLRRVSTGQRAALVLSIFFALNLSLRRGPPQMLIDDPIAHIDDLNALSFLDFLGDVAESGRRQVFFATANEKLANLFQKKMEFLGDDFKIFAMPTIR